MERFWNRELKKAVFWIALIGILGGVLCNLALLRFQRLQMQEIYRNYAGIIGALQEKYPQVGDEEILALLNSGEQVELGRDILDRYGIFEEGSGFQPQERGFSRMYVWLNVFLLLALGGIMAVFLRYQRSRSRKISLLGSYVDRVSHGDYALDLWDNEAEELSGLKNELYKLTVLYREQAELAQRSKIALADWVADISHQLKTPLTSVVVLADNLMEDPNMDPAVRQKFLQEISRQLMGMKWLVLTMLKLSRLDAGVVELQKEQISLWNIAEPVLRNLELMAEWKEIEFEVKPKEKEGDFRIQGDAKWLEEALQNVVKNALEHSPQGGKVELAFEENDVYVQVSVKDQGEGISETDQKHLFERFYRASKTENENAGLGLALAKMIVEKHNGYISVDSSEAGSTFHLRFIKHP